MQQNRKLNEDWSAFGFGGTAGVSGHKEFEITPNFT